MKFTINTYDFKSAMEKAYKCVNKKCAIKALQNLLLHIEKDNSYIVGTNINNWVVSNVQINNVVEPADIVFGDTDSLFKAMKFFKGFEISFDVQDNKVIIDCGGKQTSQIFLDKDEFLPIPEMDMSKSQEYKYNIKSLKERFNLVKYAVSKSTLNPILTGIHFNGTDIVALDGSRVAMNTSTELDVSVPFTAQLDGLALMSDVLNRDITILVNDKCISVSDRDTTVFTRLLAGVYFDYKRVIPQNANEMQVDVAEYSETLKYFKAFKKAGDKCQIIAWLDDSLMLAGTDNRGELSTLKGEFQSTIGFNNQYMLDALTQFKTENVKFNMSSSAAPIVIRDDEGNLALVLPIRLADEVKI